MACGNFCFKAACCCLAVILWMPLPAWADGDLDAFFDPGAGASSYVNAMQPDGKIIVGGNFSEYNDFSRNKIARINADGSLDTSFNPGTGTGAGIFSSVNAVAVQPDGKVLIAGSFSTINDIKRNKIARLNSDGFLDTTFDPENGANGSVYCMILLSDDKILIAGDFSYYNGTRIGKIARLNSDGSLDTTFDPEDGANGSISCMIMQPDGKILIGGYFTEYNDIARNKIARLNAGGSLDETFDPGTGANDDVRSIAVQSDGKILIAGEFTSFNEISRKYVARLNADGSVDTSFDTDWGANNGILSMLLQSDGKILIGGDFTQFKGQSRNGIARLNSDGSLDTDFYPGLGVGSSYYYVKTMVFQSDNKILIGGSFYDFNDTPRKNIARLMDRSVISVERSFDSSCYFAGGEMSVTLTAAPVAGVTNYLIEDTPPSRWTVSNISHEGTFDSDNRKVKFGPFFDSTARTLTYDLTLPSSTETGDKTFEGKAFADSSISSIAGHDVLISCLEYLPADVNENFSLSGQEIAAYGAAWKKGETWELPPNPVPIEYVTRAGMLWRGGEDYKLDTSAGTPPLCWISKRKRSAGHGSRTSDSSANREISDTLYLTGETFTVTVSVSPADAVLAYAVEEEMPPEWSVSVGDPGHFDDVNHKVKFGPFMDNEARTLTYEVTPLLDAAGSFAFSGTASFDGENLRISGNDKVTISGDVDGDGKTDLADLISILKILAGFDGTTANLIADINGDGKIGLAEAIFFLEKLSG